MDEFVNRETELTRLQKLYDSDDPEMAVVYGRRRMGKTELVRQSVADRRDAVHFLATETTRQVQLEAFVETAENSHPGVGRIQRDWEQLLGYLAEQDAVIVLDEFPYLVEADASLPSVIQRLWDDDLRETAATIVLIGSSIGMMTEKVLSGGSPLFGRLTAKFDLRQLDFGAAMEFFPEYDVEERVFAWGVYGGTPHYLQAVDDDRPLAENIRASILSKQGFLHNEPEYVLRMELSEPNTYFGLLTAIAEGRRSSNEIAQTAGVDSDRVSYYLKNLQNLWIIERDVPVTERPSKSRLGRYRLRDPLFRFWFRFVYGYEDRYEQMGADAYDELAPALPDFVSPAFERLCQLAVRPLYEEYTFTDVGRWWYQDHEVDVVGLTTGETVLVGECKFTNDAADYSALQSLERAAEALQWMPDTGGEPNYEYALFGRSGFTRSVEEAANDRDDLHIFNLEQTLEALG